MLQLIAMEDVHNEPKSETEKPISSPVMDVMPPSGPPIDNRPHLQPADYLPKPPITPHSESKTKTPAEQKPKQPSKGIGTAITATVIIVIAMAVLATYAYLKTAR